MEEIWKPIVIEQNGVLYDYTGLYEVSNLGRIRSLNFNGKKGRVGILKARNNGTGYLNVVLYKNKKSKRFYVHRIVAFVWIENDNPTVKTFVNHMDCNRQNNSMNNLEWCDRQYNNEYSLAKKVICLETGEVFPSTKEVERKLGLPQTKISNCCNGRQKTCGGYHWEYVD